MSKSAGGLVSALLLAASTSPASADLFPQPDGTVFHDVLNIYWLEDANLAATETFGVAGIEPDGRMLWDQAVEFIAAMNAANYKGHSDWRLVNMNRDGDEFVVYCSVTPADCADNEYGYLFHQEGISFFNHSPPFSNVQNDERAGYYWSGTEYLGIYAWWFNFSLGGQNFDWKGDASALHYVWPVRDGGAPAALSITKASEPESVAAGADFTYIIDVQNTGANGLAQVTVSDTLPVGVTFLGPLPLGCTESAPGTIDCNYATLAAGAALQIQLNVRAPSTPGVDLWNTATAAADGSSSVSATVNTYVYDTTTDVYIEKFAPVEKEAGELFAYQVVAHNPGPGVATDVTVTDVLPEYMSFESVISANGNSCTHDASTRTVHCLLGDMGSVSSDFIFIDVRPLRVGAISNTASIATTSPGDAPENNQSTAVTNVVLFGATVTDTVNATDDRTLDFGFVPLGVEVTGDLTVTNTNIPGGENLTIHGDPPVLPDPPFHITSTACFGATLLPGESCTETIRFMPVSNGFYSADFDLQLNDLFVPVSVSGTGGLLQTDIAVSKIASDSDLALGDSVEFTIVVRNASSAEEGAPASVLVTDKLPAPFRIPDDETVEVGQGTYDPASGEWHVGELAPGESAEMSIPAVVENNPPGGRGCITNVATAEILPTDPPVVESRSDNNRATKMVSVSPPGCADLAITQIDQRAVVSADKTLFYWSLTVVNNGIGELVDPVLVYIEIPRGAVAGAPFPSSLEVRRDENSAPLYTEFQCLPEESNSGLFTYECHLLSPVAGTLLPVGESAILRVFFTADNSSPFDGFFRTTICAAGDDPHDANNAAAYRELPLLNQGSRGLCGQWQRDHQ